MSASIPNLDCIGIKHGTDKASTAHDYLHFYESHLGNLRHEPIRLLEIGVFQGKSVGMWREYFDAATIIGVDINPAARQYASDRIRIKILDQSNVVDLVSLGTELGPFDVIIDDGSHYWSHQITSLQYLYPFLTPRGSYIVEDLDTSFGNYAPDHSRGAAVSAFAYLQKLCQYVVAGPLLNPSSEEDGFIRTFASRTEFIAFRQGTALLRARRIFERRDIEAPPLLVAPRPGDLVEVTGPLTAHLGLYGDVTVAVGLRGGARGSRVHAIQGFVIEPRPATAQVLEYRARLEDGRWTAWVDVGTFVGTRGKAESLHGYAARLKGPLAERYDCICTGSFVGEPDIQQSVNGAECVGTSGAALEAMQIVVRARGIGR